MSDRWGIQGYASRLVVETEPAALAAYIRTLACTMRDSAAKSGLALGEHTTHEPIALWWVEDPLAGETFVPAGSMYFFGYAPFGPLRPPNLYEIRLEAPVLPDDTLIGEGVS